MNTNTMVEEYSSSTWSDRAPLNPDLLDRFIVFIVFIVFR